MGKRKASAKPPPRKRMDKLDAVFSCPFCNHGSSIEYRIDMHNLIGEATCQICQENFSTTANVMSKLYIELQIVPPSRCQPHPIIVHPRLSAHAFTLRKMMRTSATPPSSPCRRALPLVIPPQLFQFRPPESLAAGHKHLAIAVCFSAGAVV